MFRIRRIFDDVLPVNQNALKQVTAILRSQFELLDRRKIDRIPELLRDPLKYGFRSVIYIAEDNRSNVRGLAFLDHDAELKFCYLDYLASDKKVAGRGIGGALYHRVRNEALSLGVTGIFFECLPDDPILCRDSKLLKENLSVLRFYEAYGARPIINTAYETPIHPDADSPPYLVFDDLGQNTILRRSYLKKVVSAILQRKYKEVCGPDYIKMVSDSIQDNPIQLRPSRYAETQESETKRAAEAAALAKIALVVTDKHEIHHVHDRGYVESPVRIRAIRRIIDKTDLFEPVAPDEFNESWITAVHYEEYVKYFKKACMHNEKDTPIYPYVFPIRNRTRPPVELPIRAGYYCIDTFTPINKQAYIAARRAVDCALTGARELISGRRITYVLVRPPGHHAERAYFGGFCYFNNAAIATQYLSQFGKIAILDIDYHHGNGQQNIFYRRNDVLTISIHGHPRFAYPYFTGFSDEKGERQGTGYNINYPMRENTEAGEYMATLRKALRRTIEFQPTYLVVCLGLDTAKGDPTGTWTLKGVDFKTIGMKIGALGMPCLVIQEGGYNTRSIGSNVKHFFNGILSGSTRSGSIKRTLKK